MNQGADRSTSPPVNPLGTQSIGRLLVKYAVPSIISMLVMSIYNIVDQIFIGRSAAGYLGNGATTVAFPLITVMLAISLLIGNGAAAYINLQMGRGNYEAAKKTTGNCILAVVFLGVFLCAAVLLFLKPILTALGATDLVMPYAVDYTSVIVLGAPFAMTASGLTAIIRSDGSPRFSMIAALAGAGLNVILDPIFIFPWGLNLGVKGAALATVLSQVVSSILVLYYLTRKAKFTRLELSGLKPDFRLLRTVAAYGSSSFVTQMAISIVNVVMNNTLRHYGALSVFGSEIPLSAMGIVMKINAILISIILGTVIGAQPILGYNYGAGNYRRVRRTYLTEICITATLAGIVNLLFIVTPGTFIGIFGEQEAQFNQFASMALRTYLCCVTAAGIQIPSANYFQAVGKPLKAMTLSMMRQLFLLVPALLILPVYFGLNGALYAGPVADIGSFLITGSFILREMRQLSARAEPSVQQV